MTEVPKPLFMVDITNIIDCVKEITDIEDAYGFDWVSTIKTAGPRASAIALFVKAER